MTDPRWNKLDTLILVAGHAIYVASDFSNPSRDDSWLLQPFQKGEPPSFIQHIEAGVSLAAMDQSSLLVFSGGQTRVDAGARKTMPATRSKTSYSGYAVSSSAQPGIPEL